MPLVNFMNSADATAPQRLKHLFCTIAVSIFLFTLFGNAAYAQQHFEGRLTIELTDVEKSSSQQMDMLVQENRLRLLGNLASYTELPMTSGGITLRADKGDMLMFAEDNKVVVLNLREMGGFLQQMMNQQGESIPETEAPATQLERTSEQRSMHGMNAHKFLLTDRDNPQNEVYIWAAEELFIDWENLISPVAELGADLTDGLSLDGIDWPMQLTPLYAEMFEDGTLTTTLEITELESRVFDRNELDIPDGHETISFFQFMMQQQN